MAHGKKAWNTKSRPHFNTIRSVLRACCPGLKRCHYCEDSEADEVEHVYPKDFYPERAFVWENYVFSCGPCNGTYKRNAFAVFDTNGNVLEFPRKPSDPASQPPAGQAVFLDPRVDDPFDYLDIDFETGMLQCKHPKGTRSHERGSFTIELLRLNRDILKEGRATTYRFIVSRLRDYANAPNNGPGSPAFALLRLDILHAPHRSVWEYMKVHHLVEDELRPLFENAPELLTI